MKERGIYLSNIHTGTMERWLLSSRSLARRRLWAKERALRVDSFIENEYSLQEDDMSKKTNRWHRN
jgi:hypothetical protein